MFAKISLESFVYEFTEILFFPNKKTREICDYYMIERIFPYSILTDTDSICLFFIFICKPESCAPNLVFRDVLFEVIIKNDILHRFDTSHKCWDKYNVRNENLKKRRGYFSIENIDDPCLCSYNPKEYFEEFECQSVNKKHKGLRKRASGMEFEDYAKRINSVREIETFGQLPMEKQKRNRFTVKNNQMILEETEKSKFAQINDKRYSFSDGIASLPFSHSFLKEIDFKREKKAKNGGIFTTGKTQTYSNEKVCSPKKQKNFNF